MNVPTMTMDQTEARQRYEEYRACIEGNPNTTKEDRAILLGYKALAAGKSILNLHDAVRVSGRDEEHRPRLAFARADVPRVFCRQYWDDSGLYLSNRSDFKRYRGSWHCSMPVKFGSRIPTSTYCTALVPLIPASVRPKNDLARYCVLWEAEWQDVPTDPLLLAKLTGPLYVVLAAWDLTDLERAVLRGRLNQTT